MASGTFGAPPPACCAICTRSFLSSEGPITAPRDTDLPSLAEAAWLKASSTRAVFAAMRSAGHAARAVGGVVRNSLMGRPITDIDIATPASPEAVMEAARAAGLTAIPTGIDHGTVTVLAEGVPYEVTTLRRDVETDGRRAVVAFTGDWAEDARRRDFTMNALYCDESGRVHDPIGGYADLAAGRVRFIGDARARIREDYLRILRFFRVYAVYGSAPLDAEGLAACVSERAGLGQLSAERIRAEMVKLLVAPRALEATGLMAAHGLLVDVLGMAPRLAVLARAVEAEAALALAPDPMLRLSALAVAVDEDRARLARHLRLSTEERRALRVVDLSLAETLAPLDGAAARRALYRTGVEAWARDVAALATLGPAFHATSRRLVHLAAHWPVPSLPVRGADLIGAGIRSGPEIGIILAEIEAWWVAEDFPAEPAVRARLEAVLAARKGR